MSQRQKNRSEQWRKLGKNNVNKKGCGLLGILTLVLVLYWLWPASSSLEGKAWVISKDIVRARLVPPSTASFGSYDTQKTGESTVTVIDQSKV